MLNTPVCCHFIQACLESANADVFACSAFASTERERKPIEITLPDGTVKEGTSYETSPMAIALGISKGLAERIVIAQVNGDLWDLDRPLEESCKLELLDFEHPKGD